jgi:glyoxylate reductase
MPAGKPEVVVTRKLPEPVEARMLDLFEVKLNPADRPLSSTELIPLLQDAQVLAPTVSDRITAEVIAAAGPGLKLIANFGVGVDHIDLKAAAARGIKVSNTPGVLTDDTADIAMSLILACARRTGEAERVLRAGGFDGWRPTWMMGQKLSGKRLAIVGMGRIGQATARRARAFGMEIHYHNRSQLPDRAEMELGATWWPDLDAMLAEADVVSLSCPRTPQTFHLMSAKRIARLKPTAILVNTARGDVIDEAALAEALIEGRIAAAGLDVYEQEPRVHPRLLEAPNAVLYPHLGSGTIETRTAMGDKVIDNILAMVAGKPLPDEVA